MRDPYLDALKQLDQMRDRAEKAEATIQRVRELCDDERFSQCSCGRCPIQVDARDILRALDGDAE